MFEEIVEHMLFSLSFESWAEIRMM